MSARGRRWLWAACAAFVALDALLALLVGAALWRGASTDEARRDRLAARIGITDEMTPDQRDEQYAIAVGEAMRRISLNSEPVARGGMLNLNLCNAADSPCAVQLTLLEAGTRRALASTDLLTPGGVLQYVPVEGTLAAGQYQCLALCDLFSTRDGCFLGRAARQVLLTAE